MPTAGTDRSSGQGDRRLTGRALVPLWIAVAAMLAGASRAAAPDPPDLVEPAPSGVVVESSDAWLDVHVTDPDGDPFEVTFHGRLAAGAPADDFSIIHFPDTQIYAESYPSILLGMTQWIVDHRAEWDIVYAGHQGDMVNVSTSAQWDNVDAAMSLLEADDLPYGVSPGNHDGAPNATGLYNDYFGVSRFVGRPYYGGHFGGDNDNNYTLFSGGGMDFIVVSLEMVGNSSTPDPAVLTWADGLLQTYDDRRAIVLSHYLIEVGEQSDFGTPGQAIYDALKGNPNLFLMLCGHMHGEGKRVDSRPGMQDVVTLIADYQDYTRGGDGRMRILEFSPADDEIRVFTYSPETDQYDTDADSQFTLPYDMAGGEAFRALDTVSDVASGGHARFHWSGLGIGQDYEWYVEVSDGTETTTGPVWSFTTACADHADCDDGNPCTMGTCVGGSCEQVPAAGTSCDDGNPCTWPDACLAGACEAGVAVDCPAGQSCDPSTGNCRTDPMTVHFRQGVDGYAGATDTYCELGVSVSNETASGLRWDSSPPRFALLRFESLFDSEVAPGPIPTGVPILGATLSYVNDNDPGNAAELHEVDVDWSGGVVYDGFGGDPGVQAGEYDPAVVTSVPDAPAGSIDVTSSLQRWANDPSDNRGWLVLATGSSGVTIRSSDYPSTGSRPELTVTYASCLVDSDCDDLNPCTIDDCRENLCEYTPDNLALCDDGDPCTEDACQAGSCAGSPVDCGTVTDACNAGVCDPDDGSCLAVPANDGGPCDDGVGCTTADTCAAGICAGQDGCSGGQYCNPGLDACLNAVVLTLPGALDHCPDGTFVIPIHSSPFAGVTTINLGFTFDSSVLQVSDAVVASLEGDPALSVDLSNSGSVGLTLVGDAPFAGSGALAWVVGRTTASGPAPTALSWTDVSLDDVSIGAATVDGAVTVTGAQSAFALPESVAGEPGEIVTVPVSADPAAGSGLDLRLEFDPGVLQPTAVRRTVLSQGHVLTFNSGTPGVLLVSLFGTTPLSGSGPILDVDMQIVGQSGQASPLLLTRADVDEGLVTACVGDGMLVVCSPPSAVGPTLVLGKGATGAVLTWDGEGLGSDYRLYKGFHQTGAPFEYNQACQGEPIGGESVTDADVPIPYRIFYYIVARDGACGESVLHFDSTGTPIPNDDPCPSSQIDDDLDGVPDLADVCPSVADPTQQDTDGDGHGDLCDDCPTVFDPAQVDRDGDGTGDACEARTARNSHRSFIDSGLFW